MRYFVQFAYPYEAGWTESFKSYSDRLDAIIAAQADGVELIHAWQEPPMHLTLSSLRIRQVRSRRHYRKLCRLVIGGWLK